MARKRKHSWDNPKFAVLISEAIAAGWDPIEENPAITSKDEKDWKCPNPEHPQYRARIDHRTREKDKSGCPYCGGRRVLKGSNDFRTYCINNNLEYLLYEVDGWDPSEVAKQSDIKRNWKCRRNPIHKWEASPNQRCGNRDKRTGRQIITGCNTCTKTGHKLLSQNENDFATLYPELAAQAVGWDPSIVLPHCNDKQIWKCPGCNDIFQDSRTKRIFRFHQDSSCALLCLPCRGRLPSGYSVNKKGYLYLVEGCDKQKIGITNNPNQRIKRLVKSGYSNLLDCLVGDGYLIFAIEQIFLKDLQNKKIIISKKRDTIKIKGKLESWNKNTFRISCLDFLEKNHRNLKRVDDHEMHRLRAIIPGAVT